MELEVHREGLRIKATEELDIAFLTDTICKGESPPNLVVVAERADKGNVISLFIRHGGSKKKG